MNLENYVYRTDNIGNHCRDYCEGAGRKSVVIFDLDGTIACGKHRLNLLPKQDLHLTESWLEFNQACTGDGALADTIQVLRALIADNICIILTGRSDDVEDETESWLEDNDVPYDYLVMRSKHDNRKDTIIKEEFLRKVGIENILCAFDDSPNVIKYFRSLGITTYAVIDYGDEDRNDLKSHGVEKLEENK